MRGGACGKPVWPWMLGLLLLLGAFLPGQSREEAPDPSPTAEETLLLELVNRFRADPVAAAEIIAASPPPRALHPELDWEMFKSEVKALPPAPPLVFNPRLVLAARSHAVYLARHRVYGHLEEEGKEGFTGAQPSDRVRFSGYPGWAGECTGGHAPNAWSAYFGLVVDDGPGGAGGMQEGRGHRLALINPRAREFGAAWAPSESTSGPSGIFVVLVGGGREIRLAGGVAFVDLNGNRLYEVGEGVEGVRVSAAGEKAAMSWPGGAWSLELGSDKPGALKATFRGCTFTHRMPAGLENVEFDVEVGGELLARIRDLVARLRKLPDPEGSSARKPRFDLLVLGASVPLPPELRLEVDTLVGSLAAELKENQQRVMTALEEEEARGLARILSDARRSYRGTLADVWFAEAERAGKVRRLVLTMEEHASRSFIPAKPLREAQEELERVLQELTEPHWRGVLEGYAARLRTFARGSGQDRGR